MTKNEIIRELIKCKVTKICRIIIVYHNVRSASFYYFDYDCKKATPLQRMELCECMMSLYKLRKSIVGLYAIYQKPNNEGIFVPKGIGFFDTRFRSCANVSEFIECVEFVKK